MERGYLYMISKFLEATRNCIVEKGHQIQLEYYLIETKLRENSEELETLYGIEIIKRNQDSMLEFPMESDMISGISENKEKVRQILNQLIAYTVTPVTLPYVLDDYFYETPFISS